MPRLIFVQRFTDGFSVIDRKTITAGMIISTEAVNSDTWVTGTGPISPFMISSTWPGLNNERMSAYIYNNIIAIHNAESFTFTSVFTSCSIPIVFLFAFIFLFLLKMSTQAGWPIHLQANQAASKSNTIKPSLHIRSTAPRRYVYVRATQAVESFNCSSIISITPFRMRITSHNDDHFSFRVFLYKIPDSLSRLT